MDRSTLSRRQFLGAGLGVGVGAGAAAMFAGPALARDRFGSMRVPAPDTYFVWVDIAKDVRLVIGVGWNAVAIRTADGTVLIDTKTSPYASTLKREVGEVSGAVVRVVNTSHHAEVTGGNHAFTKAVPVYGHAKAGARIEAQQNLYFSQLKEGMFDKKSADKATRDKVSAEYSAIYKIKDELRPADFKPTKTIDAEEKWTVGGIEIEVTPVGPAMTDNDLIVRLPKLNIVCVGGLVCPGEYPPLEPDDGASVAGWEKALAAIKGKCDAKTVVVCSIGGAKGKADVKAVDTQIAYFATLRRMVTKAIDNKLKRMDVLKINASELGKLAAPERLKRSIGAMYDEIAREGLK